MANVSTDLIPGNSACGRRKGDAWPLSFPCYLISPAHLLLLFPPFTLDTLSTCLVDLCLTLGWPSRKASDSKTCSFAKKKK